MANRHIPPMPDTKIRSLRHQTVDGVDKFKVHFTALDDNHKNQAVAQKLLMDRMLSISVCDKNADIREKITINISSAEIPDREEKVINQ